jgi:hypothetical protein
MSRVFTQGVAPSLATLITKEHLRWGRLKLWICASELPMLTVVETRSY